jgi:hypothetical protein
MKPKMTADTVQANLSWRGEFAYFRKKMPDGREKWQSLGQLSLDDARRAVKHMIQKLTAEQLEEKLGMITRRSNYAKIGTVLQAYDLYVAGIEIDPITVLGNKAALRRILATVHGDSFDVDGAETTLLTKDLLVDYSAAMIARRKEQGLALKWNPEQAKLQLQRAQRTIGSNVQQARSVFSRAALDSRPYQELELPDLKAFLEAKVGESTVVRYVPPPFQVLERIAADVPALKKQDPAMWLALMLEVNGGCRRSSAVEARWEWFVEGLDREQRPMVDLDVRYAKGGNSLVRFDWTLYQEMKAMRQDLREFIVPGADPAILAAAKEEKRPTVDREARQEVFIRLVAWLRARGLNQDVALKPNHQLRKWYIDQKRQLHGNDEAQSAAGHSDASLLQVYSQRRTFHSLRVI